MLLKNELLNVDFYINSMSLFLRESFGMRDRCTAYFRVLKNVSDVSEEIFNRMNIFSVDENGNPNYFEITGVNPAETKDKFLDVIASIFGLNRQVMVPPESPTEQLILTNKELLIYIECTIFRNTYDGSNEMLLQLYTGSTIPNYKMMVKQAQNFGYVKNTVFKTYVSELHILFRNGNTNLQAEYIMLGENVSGNLLKLFDNGYLTIESMGIVYNRISGTNFVQGKFDTATFYSPTDTTVYLFG